MQLVQLPLTSCSGRALSSSQCSRLVPARTSALQHRYDLVQRPCPTQEPAVGDSETFREPLRIRPHRRRITTLSHLTRTCHSQRSIRSKLRSYRAEAKFFAAFTRCSTASPQPFRQTMWQSFARTPRSRLKATALCEPCNPSTQRAQCGLIEDHVIRDSKGGRARDE